jgi:hypothetical protein
VTFDARHSVGDGLNHLAGRIDPIIASTLAPHLHGLPWTAVLSELDRAHGKPPKVYAATDLQAQLKMLTERLGGIGFPFDDHTRLVSTLGSELRIVRNRWAHNDELTTLDAWRAHDFVVRLLEHFADTDGMAGASVRRDEAFGALAAEKGVAVHVAVPAPEPEPVAVVPTVGEVEVVAPDPSVLTRTESAGTPTIGAARDPFEPWRVVLVGDVSVLDDLPKKVAKEKVRAVAVEIAEFEGPIHLDRLAQLTAASFGLQRLRSAREKKLTYQIRQTGLLVDADKFVWPSDLDPSTWSEFRPNDSTVDRPFLEISPVEIANAMRFIRARRPGLDNAALDAATLQTFGRKRRTKQITAHLARAKALLTGDVK